MTKLICPECGAENESTAKLCSECGTSLLIEDLLDKANIDEPIGDELERLSEAETDLPGLLHALKQEDTLSEKVDSTEENETGAASQEPEAVDNLPEWLDRIRQRVTEEEDALGEMIQKLSAAQESLSRKKDEGQEDEFSSWIEQLREEDGSVEKEKEDPDPDAEDTEKKIEETPGWLEKIRKISGISEVDQDAYSIPGGDSLLQWLVDLEDGKEILKGIPKPGLDFLDEDFDGGATQEMHIRKQKVHDINITRDEQAQADQLQATIVDEGAVRQIRRKARRPIHWVRRLLFAILLIGGITLALSLGEPQATVDRPLKPQNQALLTWVEETHNSGSYIIVFDYEAGHTQEMSLVALPVLERLIDETTEVAVVSTSISGTLLAQDLLSQVEADRRMGFRDLGYFPSSSYGAYGLFSRGQGTWPFADLPDHIYQLPFESYDGILILSGFGESARSWVEQVSILAPATPINMILTAQAGPLLLPYWESGQVSGMISGISEAAAVEALIGEGSEIAIRWRAYQTGILLLISVMLIGAFIVVERTPSVDRGSQDE